MAKEGRDGVGSAAARSIWQKAAAGEDHDRARGYFKARGIPLEHLPTGKLPACLRYVDVHPYYQVGDDGKSVRLEDGPAILARVDGADGRMTTIHRTYLDPGGEPKKRGGVEAKKLLGSPKNGAIRLSEGWQDGILCLTEGIETGLAVLAAAPWMTVWACISSSGLRTLELPEGLVVDGTVSMVIIAADRDRSDAGRMAAVTAAARFRAAHRELEVRIAMPSMKDAPALFGPAGELPEGVKGVDWLDVLTSAGADAVFNGVLTARLFQELDRPDDVVPEERKPKGPDPLPRGELDRARRALGDLFPPEPARIDRRWRIARWGGDWWWYDQARKCWRAVPEEAIRGQLHHYLAPMKTYGKGGDTMMLAPNVRTVEGILRAMATDAWVNSDTMPCWLPPTHDERGEPLWGSASRLDATEAAGPVSPGAIVAARNGLLDVDAWERGEVVTYPHTPRWFTRSSLPFDLPLERLKEAAQDDADAEALCLELCPTWLKFLDSITEGQPDREVWIRCLRQWFGYFLVHDNSLEAILALIGPPRSGKGTILRAIEVVVGKEGCVPTSLNDLAEKYELSMLVGKQVAIMGDAHVGQRTDPVRAVEMLKGISGGDAFSTEEKYKAKVPNVRPKCRFVICANTLPKLPDPSGALASRLTVLTMHKSWLGDEDRTLKPRVLAEAAGIMVWALFGLRDLRANGGFVSTAEGKETLLEFARLNAPVMSFVQDCCEVGPDHECVTKALYDVYCSWAKEHGHKHEASMPTFGAQLRSACPAVRKVEKQETKLGVAKRWHIYQGIKPTAAAMAQAEPKPYINDTDRLDGLP